MQEFILRHNIALFEKHLELAEDDKDVQFIRVQIHAWRRELAAMQADTLGAAPPGMSPDRLFASARLSTEFRSALENADMPSMLIDPREGLHIIHMNEPYARATMTSLDAAGGERLFDIFPDNSDDPTADGVANLYNSLRKAAETGQPHAMAIQRYDVRDADGTFVRRYWLPKNTPILDENGRLLYLLHEAVDVTAQMKGQDDA